jgi:hypothetical protein
MLIRVESTASHRGNRAHRGVFGRIPLFLQSQVRLSAKSETGGKIFGELIREARKRAGLTQREISARIKLDEGRPNHRA